MKVKIKDTVKHMNLLWYCTEVGKVFEVERDKLVWGCFITKGCGGGYLIHPKHVTIIATK